MFKHLGRFAILAVCLFALAMVGCNGGEGGNGNGKGTDIIKPAAEPTPMEKLTGFYSLVEAWEDNEEVARPPEFSGSLFLYSDGTSSMHLTVLGNFSLTTGTWSVDKTHLTLDGERGRYTWDGTHLTISDADGSFHIKWRKD